MLNNFSAHLCRKPCPYQPQGRNTRDAYKGKQFIAQIPKPGKLPSIFFEKEHPYVAKVSLGLLQAS